MRALVVAVARAVPSWWVADVLVPFAVTRAVFAAIGYMAFRLPVDPALATTGDRFLDMWSRWDGQWYLAIARDGYSYVPGQFSSVAFAPLLPILMRVVAWPAHDGTAALVAAGIGIANVSLLVAATLLVLLFRDEVGQAVAGRASRYLMLFPTSFFLSAVYPESLFLALAIGSFLAARRGRWWLAGALAALATLTRPYGLVVVATLALEYAWQHRWRIRKFGVEMLSFALAPAAYAGWLLYLWRSFGDPLAGMHAESVWQRGLAPPWQAFVNFFTPPRGAFIDLAFALLFIALAVFAWRTLRAPYALYTTLTLLIILCTGQLYSLMRLGLELFPAFAVLAIAGRTRLLDRAYSNAALLIGGAFMAFFASALFFFA